MTPYRYNKLTIIGIGLFFAAVLGYAYFEGLPLLRGPSIVLDIPTETITTTEPYLQISGGAQRINSLSLNGRDLILTESGTFSEDILLAEGYNELVFLAVDQTGREAREVMHVLYAPPQKEAAEEILQSN